MKQSLMLWPIMGQLLLVMLLYLYLAIVKAREIKAGNVNRGEIAVDQEQWPASVRLINNNLRNQFETPILFYVLSILLWGLGAASKTTLALACVYLVLRYVHAFVHVTSNDLRLRTPSFILAFCMLGALFVFTVKALLAVS